MGVYRYLWLTVVCGCLAFGVILAAHLVPWQSLVAVAVLAAIMGPLLAAGLYTQRHGTAGPPLRYVLAGIGLGAVGAVAVSGLITELGAAALGGSVLLALTSPPLLRLLHVQAPRRRRSRATPAAAPQASSTPAPHLPAPPSCRTLSDAELCWRWRTSFCALQRTVSPGEQLRLAETRAALMDELARRHPAEFTRWLDSGARAGSDPARFLSGTHHDHAPRRTDKAE